jgi:ATP-dependent DNA ligase
MKGRTSWRSELKLNGQRNGVYISPEGEVQFWNRHYGHHLNWSCPSWLVQQVLEVVPPTGQWIVLDGELLHAKDRGVKNTFYWWDILVDNGEYLVGETYQTRYDRLRALIKTTETDGQIAKATPNIWIAELIQPEDYDRAWKATETSWVEGFVFKNMAGKLKPCVGEHNNHDWMVRCRKQHRAYRF